MTTTLYIQNLKCNGCVNTITNKLSLLTNISAVKVDIETNSVTFNYVDTNALQSVKKTLNSNGYPEEGENNPLGTKAKSFVSCAIGKMS
jgi:copper chaperone CopZ